MNTRTHRRTRHNKTLKRYKKQKTRRGGYLAHRGKSPSSRNSKKSIRRSRSRSKK